jgi:cellulose synthase/poly-beta-1,6-N-acetylglucosamine synthase-like glycosyltransferase/peptidoglycan/xylan/chitin deacetylase (PgdA/CDA1 family)
VLFVISFFTALSLPVIAQRFTGHSAAANADLGRNSSFATAGPVLDLRRGGDRWSPVPRRAVALTFDDGPDPRWTPAILKVLGRHHVHATFFVVGARVLQDPQIVRQELAGGNDIGSHTFSHPQMGGLSTWQQDLQLSLTDKAIAGATGLRTRLYRPPYSSRPVNLTGAELESARRASSGGRYVVLSNYIGFDWLPGSPARLAQNASPPAGESGVVMFHDGGGDRHRTVEAVDRLITTLEQRHYRFMTVSKFSGLSRRDVLSRASLGQRAEGQVLQWTGWFTHWITTLFGAVSALLLLIGVARGVAVVAYARRHRNRQRREHFDPGFAPDVSVVIPAFNEASGIAAAVRSIAGSEFPGRLEVLVVDDGSTDATAAIVADLDLPRVSLIRQANAGKAAALNAGIGRAQHDTLVLVDADTVLEPQALHRLLQPLRDPTVGAVSGNAKVANRRGLINCWQHVEYVISCSVERRMFDVLECMPCVPGAIGAYRREALESAGGLSHETLAEDTDLTMAIQRGGWRVRYQADARGWTEVPATLKDLWRQRYRWSYGTLQAMWKHRRAPVERGGAGRFGRRGIPYLAFYTIVLPIFSPAVDLFAIYGVVVADTIHALETWAAVNFVTLAVGAYAFRLDRERAAPLLTVPLQQFVYRQMMYGVVLHAMKSALLGIRVRWQRIARTGDFHTAPVTTGPPVLQRASAGRLRAPAAVARATSPPVTRPIFVDESRRRARRAIRAGLATAGVASVAAVAIFASVVLPADRTSAIIRLPVGPVARVSSHARAADAGSVLHVRPVRYAGGPRISKRLFYRSG